MKVLALMLKLCTFFSANAKNHEKLLHAVLFNENTGIEWHSYQNLSFVVLFNILLEFFNHDILKILENKRNTKVEISLIHRKCDTFKLIKAEYD